MVIFPLKRVGVGEVFNGRNNRFLPAYLKRQGLVGDTRSRFWGDA